jgi:O-antigen/teichoic acid export membrane protein
VAPTRMTLSTLSLVRGTIWTVGAFGLGQSFRLITNVALARLLAPELFGIMVIVNSIRTGVDLLSDVGIGQNIVYNKNAENPDFYDTAWTLRLIRAALLWLACIAAAVPISHFYAAPILVTVVPVAGLFFLIAALGSVAMPLLQRNMRFARLNSFEVVQEMVSSATHVLLAYLTPTIWALVFGGLISMAARSAGSYVVLPNVRHRLYISKEFALQMFSFGKWIFISSIIYFLSMNFDRLYYGKVAALGMLGVYGIARALSDLVGALILRVSAYLVFPLVAGSRATPRDQLRTAVAMKRFTLLLIGAIGIAILTTTADVVIKILFDQRYQAAGWMLPILFIGVWFSMISSLNESTLLGFGKPLYGAVANGCKFAWLLVGLPVGFAQFGTVGAIFVVAAADLWRYVPTLAGQIREHFSFAGQDLVATLAMLTLVGMCEWLRWNLGFGTSFDALPISSLAR